MKKTIIIVLCFFAIKANAQQGMQRQQPQQLQLLDSVNNVSVKDTAENYTYTGVTAILVKQGVNQIALVDGSFVISYRVLFFADKKKKPVFQQMYNVLMKSKPSDAQVKSIFEGLKF